ncbi:MAG: energy-coupling factor transporter ATPase [Lachnospiraceae bacterium]|jgi:energy-coupling factor transport system ATP-binding protein|nr:energy-coupling factor transporter ATPase [Lachnospiraceae bacterium]
MTGGDFQVPAFVFIGKDMSLIDIKNLVFEYFRRDDEGNVDEIVSAISDVSLDVEQGDFIAIVGENGSGKSTLAKHINALLTPSQGEVVVDGMDTKEEELKLSIRKTAGMVFQNPDNQIVGTIVEEDVAFGPENLGMKTSKIWNNVDDALQMTGMSKHRNDSPSSLSGGQKQKVAIAGVLAMETKCIIFDEATAMLDPKSRRQILDIAKKLNREKGITIVWITHHMDEVMTADKVYVMKQGSIAMQGTPMDIFSKPEIIKECGVVLPKLIQYINFMAGQGLLSKEEVSEINDEEDLILLLCNKFGNENKGDKPYIYNKNDEENDDLSQGLLLNDVSFTYNKGYASESVGLNEVNLHIKKGEFIAVIGDTGSGKSTLMQHLNGLLIPQNGNVFYNGTDITDKDFSVKELRQKVGLVFQYPEYQLFEETVEKEVCFGPLNMDISPVEAQKRAYKAIEAVGLPDTIYDASPFRMSGGQRRRVALASVLAMEPEYLILDEPTAGLDPVSAYKLLDMLRTLNEEYNIAIVMVSHNMDEVAEYADRIIYMDKGSVRMDGQVAEVFAKNIDNDNVEVPFGIRLLNALKNAGADVDVSCHEQLDIFGELCKLI